MLTLLSSGSNAHGQLANDSLKDSHSFKSCSFDGCARGFLPEGTQQIIDVANGANHTLVLLEIVNGSGVKMKELWGCGDGRAGQLGSAYQEGIAAGQTTTVFRKIDIPFRLVGLTNYSYKLVAASWETTYIVLVSEDGKGDIIVSLGADDFGDLGIGGIKKKNNQDNHQFHIVTLDHIAIDDKSIFGSLVHVESLVAGQHHVVAHVQVATIDGISQTFWVGWGAARHGQLGDMTKKDGKSSTFQSQPVLVHRNDLSDPVTASALGLQHTVLLHKSGHLSCLGSNRKGQTQGIANLRNVRQISCTWHGTYALVEDIAGSMRLFSAGSYSHGQLGRSRQSSESLTDPEVVGFPEPFHPYGIVCGSEHVLSLISPTTLSHDSSPNHLLEVWGWGWNEHGNLGLGTTNDVQYPRKIWPPTSTSAPQQAKTVVGVWAGLGTSWICLSCS